MNAEHAARRTPHTMQLFHLPTALAWDHPAVNSKLGRADVLVFQRNIFVKEVWDAFDYWRAIGKLVVVDLDDHYPGLPPSNPAYRYWIQNAPGLDPDPVTGLSEAMRHADALSSPSKVICQDWAHLLPTYWVPNWTRRAWYEHIVAKPLGASDLEFSYTEQGNIRAALRPESADWITLGWGGSVSHVDSWVYSGIVEALDRLFEKYPHVRLKFCGHERRLDYIFKRWGERVIYQAGVKPEHWPMVIATFDIGLAPLDMRPLPPWREGAPVAAYDERRSWLKGAEYLCAGVPWVGSDSLTYADLRRQGTLVENTAEAWFRALDHKIEFLQAEKLLAGERRRWALRKLTMEANANTYGDIYGRMIAERNGALKAPLPGILYTTQTPPETRTVQAAPA